MGTTPQDIKRFRINPVEIAIFAVVSLIFLNSVYNLFSDRQGFSPSALSPMAANPTSESRNLASVIAPVTKTAQIDLKCDTAKSFQNVDEASKVVINGELCGQGKANTLSHWELVNKTNQYMGTVFAEQKDAAKGRPKFTTDYIPLVTGQNQIEIKLSYKNGKNFNQTLFVTRK